MREKKRCETVASKTWLRRVALDGSFEGKIKGHECYPVIGDYNH